MKILILFLLTAPTLAALLWTQGIRNGWVIPTYVAFATACGFAAGSWCFL